MEFQSYPQTTTPVFISYEPRIEIYQLYRKVEKLREGNRDLSTVSQSGEVEGRESRFINCIAKWRSWGKGNEIYQLYRKVEKLREGNRDLSTVSQSREVEGRGSRFINCIAKWRSWGKGIEFYQLYRKVEKLREGDRIWRNSYLFIIHD